MLSGERLGVIEPHSTIFPQSTFSWNISTNRNLQRTLPDQFAPYLGTFDCTRDTFANGYYNGTMFRFPLRNKPSPLSDTLYGKERIDRLFECFQDDANLVLLFLRHIESVELYERGERETKPRLVFKVQISQSCLADVRQKRQEFLVNAKSSQWKPEALTTTYPITIETIKNDGHRDVKKSYSWLVTNYYSGGHVSAMFRKLYQDNDLSYPPWVGVAMPLSQVGISQEELDTQQEGHVFCFLPLPSDQRIPTGLPIHVNGFFALEQNRKSIKWPNINQRRDDLMDKRLLWNQCLLREAIPFAYGQLLLGAIELYKEKSTLGLTVENIYKAFPDFSRVDNRWGTVCVPLYGELFQRHSVVYTPADGGQWLRPQDVLFDTLEEDQTTRNMILRVLSLANIRVAQVPEHLVTAIRTCCHMNMARINATVVATAFKTVQHTQTFSNEDKINLLRYMLKQNKYEYLDGLELLPLANGEFTNFFSNPKRANRFVYISTGDHPPNILPRVDDNFLDPHLDQDVKNSLIKAATKGKHFTTNYIFVLYRNHIQYLYISERLKANFVKKMLRINI